MSFLKNLFSKAVNPPVNPAAQTMSGSAMYGEVRNFKAGDAEKTKSIALIAAQRNAAQIAKSDLHLYYTRRPGEPVPKNFPYRVITKQDDEPEKIEVFDHPALELLWKVNPFRNYHDHFEETSLSLDMVGDAFWYLRKNKIGVPEQIWLLNAGRITIIPDERDFIQGYFYTVNGKKIALTTDEVIHFRRPNLVNAYYGIGRVETAFWAIASLRERQQYEANLYKSRGVSELVVRYPNGRLDSHQRRDVAMQWSHEIQNQRGVHVADGDFQIEKIAFSPREMLAMQSHQWNIEEIVNAFGQPKALYADNPNRASIEGAIYQWGEFELDPSLARMAEKLNETYFPLFDPRLWCEFDTVAIADKDFDLRQEQADLTGHVRSVNEIRQARHLPPLDDDRADDPFALATAAPILMEPPESPEGQPKPQGGRDRAKPPEAIAGQAGTVADTALNGAQVDAMIRIVEAVAIGTLTQDAAVAIILVSFPTISEDQARRIVATPVKPKPKEEPPPEPKGKPGEGEK